MLFSIGLVSFFLTGGITGIFLGNSAIDIQLHDTYFVVAHFHLVMGSASFFGMMAGVYHWFPKMFGRMMNRNVGLCSLLDHLRWRIPCVLPYALHWNSGFPKKILFMDELRNIQWICGSEYVGESRGYSYARSTVYLPVQFLL